MTDAYPEIEPYESGMLDVGDGNAVYWEACGNPDGKPAVVLHGGPGSGCGDFFKSFFDPASYRMVLFDQRNCGRSTPHASEPTTSLAANTTAHLVGDIESLREHLGIERWLVAGGSWGTTLALAYAEHHPQRCLGLVLRGIFLCRQSEIDWFLYGLRQIFPEAWRTFAGYIPEAERGDLLSAYYKRLTDPDAAVHMPAARSWSVYEGSCSTLLPNPALVADFASDRVALGLARIEAHYFTNDIFLPGNFLLANAAKLAKVPGIIVQGRYDIVCPAVSADDLHQAWPQAAYEIVADAGHSAFEPGIRSRLVAATETFKNRLG